MLNLADKDLKADIINMLKVLKEPMVKQEKKDMTALTHQIGNIKKEIEIIKKNQMEIWS